MADKEKDPNYPKVLYHRALAPVTVRNADEHQEYSPEEWGEAPFEAQKEQKPAGKSKKSASDPQSAASQKWSEPQK